MRPRKIQQEDIIPKDGEGIPGEDKKFLEKDGNCDVLATIVVYAFLDARDWVA
jgi:hypothetical protein